MKLTPTIIRGSLQSGSSSPIMSEEIVLRHDLGPDYFGMGNSVLPLCMLWNAAAVTIWILLTKNSDARLVACRQLAHASRL